MAYVVNCPCGVTIREETEDELVTAVQKHGQEVHSHNPSREEVLEMAKPE